MLCNVWCSKIPLHFAYIFQLSSHDKLVNSKTFHIQLFIHIQSFLAKEIKECQQNLRVIINFFFQMYSSVLSPTNFVLQSLPDKNLESLSKVCRTFSLATLKNIFPPSSHFTRSGNTSNVTSSAYVTEYIGKYFNIFHSKNSIEDMTPNPKTIKSN